jgi:hypothetical protein
MDNVTEINDAVISSRAMASTRELAIVAERELTAFSPAEMFHLPNSP